MKQPIRTACALAPAVAQVVSSAYADDKDVVDYRRHILFHEHYARCADRHWLVELGRSAPAMQLGTARNGTHLFPAFPYTSFTKVSDADVSAIYAYLRTLPALRYRPPDNDPLFATRWSMVMRPAACWAAAHSTHRDKRQYLCG